MLMKQCDMQQLSSLWFVQQNLKGLYEIKGHRAAPFLKLEYFFIYTKMLLKSSTAYQICFWSAAGKRGVQFDTMFRLRNHIFHFVPRKSFIVILSLQPLTEGIPKTYHLNKHAQGIA